jgi:hypothetical protein
MRQLYKFLTLPSDERILLARAGVLLVFIRLGLGLVPFPTLRRLVVGRPRSVEGAHRDDQRRADQVVWAVTTVNDRLPRWATTCLSSALAMQALLARRGLLSRVHVGVRRGPLGELAAHAWVERDGRILIGGSAADLAEFSPLTVFEVAARERTTVEPAAADR